MCIFSQPVQSVASTHIFVRRNQKTGRTVTVYQMEAALMGENAMILPVPGSHVEFVNLEDYPDFFQDMDKLFPEPVTRGLSKSVSFGITNDTLQVHEVGNFIASYVPTMKDFERLAPVFRLNPACWDELPDYTEYGFVVFQLKSDRGNKKFHPMAYTYNANETSIFFPTTHVHDGEVELNSEYDHKLYFQYDEDFYNLTTQTSVGRNHWRVSDRMPSGTMQLGRCQGLVSPVTPVARLHLDRVNLPNQDFVLVVNDGKISQRPQVVRGKQDTFGISNFANERHFDRTKGFTWTALSHEELIEEIKKNWDKRIPGAGERDTTRKVLVPINPERVYGSYVTILPGMALKSEVSQRQAGEDYFVDTRVADLRYNQSAVQFAKVVLYSKEALLENGGTRSTDANWEVVCLIGSDVDNEPMHPLAMARNMLEKAGGTASTYTAKEFAEAIYYWSQRVKI